MFIYVCTRRLLTFELPNTRSAYLDGAKKPWDRANSADRSMVSRWELEAAQLDFPLKYDSGCIFFFLKYTFLLLCRVRSGGGGNDSDIDFDRMKQVQIRQMSLQ